VLWSQCLPTLAQVRITEFMASNTKTLADEDDDFSDWIEIQNFSVATVSLLNWGLSDSAANLSKWSFPATNIGPGSFMVIFASGKDRRAPGAPLHTNFKLDPGGEHLALTRPDGSTASSISYPPQFPDVSYGLGMRITTAALVAGNAAINYRIPTDNADDRTWMQQDFAGAAWSPGTNGIGYETGLTDPQADSFYLAVLDTRPEAYWRLDETNGPTAVNLGVEGIADQGGYLGNIALGTAGPRPPRFSFFETNNNAPTFNGTDAFVGGPYHLLDDQTAFTIAGWIKPNGTQGDRTGLFGQNDAVEFGFISPNTLQVWTAYGSINYDYPYPTNEWHYVGAAGGNGQLALLMDGAIVASTPANPPTFGASDYAFNIGGGGIFDGSGNFFRGQIDEVAVWPRALGTNELATLVATNAQKVDFTPYLATDVQSTMLGSNATVYVRIPFTVMDPTVYGNLQLLLRFDDGFAAFLNGHPIARSNAPGTLAWNSAATVRHPDSEAAQWTAFDVTEAIPYLVQGTNVLCIQALNLASNDIDFLMQAELLASIVNETGTAMRFFSQPTPGGPNGTGAADQGPILSGAGHTPIVPVVANSLVVTAEVAPSFSAISNVTLHYRVMFGPEVALPMNDGGTNSDGTAGDGIWTGVIPAGVARPGQLLRYYVTAADTAGNISRWPIYPDSLTSQQYLGTVVADLSIQSSLPVVSLFLQDPAAGDTRNGTPGSLFFLDELYDNVSVRLHGQSSSGWPKKSHNLSLPKDHQLLYQPGASREKNIRLLSNYGDKMRMHTTLTYHEYALAGADGHFSFPVRIQQNGAFFGIEDMVEDGDDYFLRRLGRDPNGALYKMYNALDGAAGNEKKTRKWEGTDDLTALVANLDESIAQATRVRYAWDHLDLPNVADYFAAMAIASSQDVGHKNYYLYHDNDGTGQWSIMPWDVDLSWGRNWVDSLGYFSDILYQTNVLNFYDYHQQSKSANRLFDLFFATPEFRAMYLRRLRTLMDTILTPTGTPTNQLVLEPFIRQLEDLISPTNVSLSDATLDLNAWGPNWGNPALSVLRTEAERTISVHLAGRRSFLYTSPAATLNGERIPGAQPANTVVVFGAWDYKPGSGSLNEQFVELRNTNSYAVDVSGWRVAGASSFELRPGTVIPAGGSIYLSPSVNAFRARTTGPSAGQNLFVQGPLVGYLSTLGNSRLYLLNNLGLVVSDNGSAVSAAPQLLPGNLAVLRVGDGVETLSSHGNPVFVDQFTTNGAFLGSVSIPANDTNALILSGSASSEGALTRSPDGRLLVLAGYHVALSNSSASLAGSSSVSTPRALGALDFTGTFSLVGLTTNEFDKNNIRSGTTDGRGNYWGAGANSGTLYLGNSTPALIQTAVTSTRVIQALEDDLYFSTSSSEPGLWKVGGSPVANSALPQLVLASGTGSSPFGFTFNPALTVAYLADDTVAGQGGVQRWDFTNNVWAFSYAFYGLTSTGARGLAVSFSGALPRLYVTTAETVSNRLLSLSDNGPGAVVTTLATAGTNQLFRGVAFTPDAGLAPRFLQIQKTVEGVKLSWTALANRTYSLFWTTDLEGSNWLNLTNLTAASPEASTGDTPVPGERVRFYKVLLTPQ